MAGINEIDNYNKILNTGVTIYSSRETIRSQLTEYAQTYLDLKTVDLYKTSFLSYVMDILSILTANQLFYTSTIYREFFFVTSQFRESVLNLARWIGYTPDKASPSRVDVLFTIPLTFPSPGVTFAIPSDFKVFAGDVPFLISTNPASPFGAEFKRQTDPNDPFKPKTISSTPVAGATVQIINNNAITVRDSNGFNRPVGIDVDNNNKNVSFVLPFIQHEKVVKQFLIPNALEFYQFYSRKIDFNGMYSEIEVYVREPAPGETLTIPDENQYFIASTAEDLESEDYKRNGYKESDLWEMSASGLYTLSATSKEYVWGAVENQGEVFFGNGILGRQPAPGSKVLVILHVTKGEDGQIIPGSIRTANELFYLAVTPEGIVPVTSKLERINFSVSNGAPSLGGVNTPSLTQIKQSAIVNLRSKQRLVADIDYDYINEIMGPNFPVVEAKPILKRSDIKVNEIMTFLRLLYHDSKSLPEIVPTRNARIELLDPKYENGKYTITRKYPIDVYNQQYETQFNITLDQASKVATYDYVLTILNDTPAQLSSNQPFFESEEYIPYAYIPITTVDFKIDTVPVKPSSSSSSGDTGAGTYPIQILVHTNHVPSSEMRLFRLQIVTKWDNNQKYVDVSATDQTDALPWIIPETENYDLGNGDITLKYNAFRLTIPDYRTVPEGKQRIEYTMFGWFEDMVHPERNGWKALQNYFTDVIIRQDLKDMMISTITETRFWDGYCHDETLTTVHNVPVILSSYLDDGIGGGVLNTENQKNFELVVIQNLINNIDVNSKRMLTDFINIKFPDTNGQLNNLKYNPVDYIINSRYITPFANTSPEGFNSSSSPDIETGSMYIVNGPVPGYEDYDLTSYINYIAVKRSDGGWRLIQPARDTYVRVLDEYDIEHDNNVLAFDGKDWIDVQKFTIPLEIRARIRVSPDASTSYQAIITKIKETLIEYFTPKFGMNQNLDRSEITSVIRSVQFVTYCDLLSPEIDIRFNYELSDLSQKQLLNYTPQYVGFIENSISIDVAF